jgi:hypothetical protein
MLILVLLGIMLFCNGAFHAVLYLFDDKPLFSGMRYLNWLSLFIGIACIVPGMSALLRDSGTRTRALI